MEPQANYFKPLEPPNSPLVHVPNYQNSNSTDMLLKTELFPSELQVFGAGSLEFGNLKFKPFKTKLRTSEPDTPPKSPNIIRVKTNSVTIFQPAQSYFPIPAILQRYKLYL